VGVECGGSSAGPRFGCHGMCARGVGGGSVVILGPSCFYSYPLPLPLSLSLSPPQTLTRDSLSHGPLTVISKVPLVALCLLLLYITPRTSSPSCANSDLAMQDAHETIGAASEPGPATTTAAAPVLSQSFIDKWAKFEEDGLSDVELSTDEGKVHTTTARTAVETQAKRPTTSFPTINSRKPSAGAKRKGKSSASRRQQHARSGKRGNSVRGLGQLQEDMSGASKPLSKRMAKRAVKAAKREAREKAAAAAAAAERLPGSPSPIERPI
jgi:hypothetical protein